MSALTRIYYALNAEPGWAPVNHMVGLAASLFEARLIDLSAGPLSWQKRLQATLSMPARGGEGGDLYILREPAELPRVFAHPGFAARRAFRALWIIDSFWTERLMRPARQMLSKFDLVAFTRKGDAADYAALCGDRALFLGWGADVLELGSGRGPRPIDLLRIGRQPSDWDDDQRVAAACQARGIRFHGRPPFVADPAGQQKALMSDWYGRSKFVLAHSNLAAPAAYTHPERDYITARWTDALASGASVAGCQPRGDLSLIDWPGAVLDTGAINLERNLDQIAEALSAWQPEHAVMNRRRALERLDWRWRFDAVARRLGCGTPALTAEMARLHSALAAD